MSSLGSWLEKGLIQVVTKNIFFYVVFRTAIGKHDSLEKKNAESKKR